MKRACRDIEALIDRRMAGLADADRLVLEQHLGECAACRELSDVMRSVVATLERAPVSLSETSRERAMAKAFANVEAGASLRETRASSRRVGGWLAAAAALAVCVRLAVHPPEQTSEVARSTAPTKPATGARAVPDEPTEPSAVAAVEPTVREEPVAAPSVEATWYEASRRETKVYAHARVELEPGARLRFQSESATLELERGRVQVDVDASRERPFSVMTKNFRVQVLGTAFAVSPERVVVRRGRVQVFGRDGQVLARELSQGATFTYRAKTKPLASHAASDMPEQPQASAQGTADATAAELLRAARAELGRGDPSAALVLIARAEQSDPTRAEVAEARTLRAEGALLTRDRKLAVRTYLEVAEAFADLPAGENAAFAAAQLEARAQEQDGARKLFERYLARYPRGRFADEARARLHTLQK